MENCIFCKIIKGEILCHKVYEDELFFAFLDINPLNLGHTLLIPKSHYQWVDDVPSYDLYWQTAKKLTKSIQLATNCLIVAKLVYGLGVDHAHIHLIPKFENDDHVGGIQPNNKKQINPAEMALIAKKISDSVSQL